MPFDMSNLRPQDSGVGAFIHVFQDVDMRSRHGPRIKVFPGKPHEGNATVIAIPTYPTDTAKVIGKTTIGGKTLKLALRFADLNWRALALFWRYSGYGISELLADLRPVE